MIRRIRQSQLYAWRMCRRRWEMDYVRALQLIRDPGVSKGSRDLGSIVHRLMEAYYKGEDWRAVHKDEVDALVADSNFSPDWAEHYEYARIMMEGYGDWLATEAADANETVLLVEPQLEAHMGTFHGDDVILTGKPDLVVHNTLSDTVIVEDHKTTGRIQSVMLHSPQGNNYAMMLKMQHDIDVQMFRTNQLRKVKRTARATPPFYGRSEKFVDLDELRTNYRQVQGQLDEMVSRMRYFEERGDSNREEYDRLFYPSPALHCNGCDFAAICTSLNEGKGGHNYVIRNFYEPKPINAFDGVEESPNE